MCAVFVVGDIKCYIQKKFMKGFVRNIIKMENKKTKGNYVFPNIMAKMMKGISQRTQFEAELMSLTFILIGLLIMAIFTVFFTNTSVFVKVMVSVNAIAGFVFLSSRLVTSFQQYNQFLTAMGLIEEWNEPKPQEVIDKQECKEV